MLAITYNRKEVTKQLLKLDLDPNAQQDLIINNTLYTSVYDAIIRNIHQTIHIDLLTLDTIELYFENNKYMKIKNIPPEIMDNISNLLF